MPKLNGWTHGFAVAIAVLAVLLQMSAVFAQDAPPARAPTPPEEGGRKAEAAPPLPDDMAVQRRLRAEALREQWATVPRGQIQMLAVGDNIAILYGTSLCLFDGATLELKAKVDLREILRPDRGALRELRRDRGEKPARAAGGDEGAPAAEAAEQ